VLILNRGRIVAKGTMAEVGRLAAAPRRALLHVPPDRREHAVLALVGADLLAAALDGERGADVEVTLPARAPAEESSFRVLGVLHVAGIPVVDFTLEGGRLSDAFLTVTEEA
jgi:ABC-2 type transport system ATP-binding protein